MSGEKEEQEEQESILGSQCQEALLSVRLVVVDTYQAGWRTLIGPDQSINLAFCYVFMAKLWLPCRERIY